VWRKREKGEKEGKKKVSEKGEGERERKQV
jgi:hypothetical protein